MPIKKYPNIKGSSVDRGIYYRLPKFLFDEFRKHSTLTKAQQEYVRESVEEYFSRFFDAVECIGGNPLPEPPKCYTLIRTEDPEEDAKQLRG